MCIDFWTIFLIVSVIAIIVELFVPTMFCINFAFAGIITAMVSIYWGTLPQLIVMFVVLSLLSIIFIKPLLIKIKNKTVKVDFEGQYIGKVVKTIAPVTKNSGAVTVFEERWEARLTENATEDIPEGVDVKIIANDSTVLYVEKV